ncbi:MAG: mandelate racemase/muconate lactonizing enzyme family protein [Solirubrobacteraceae bacterium]
MELHVTERVLRFRRPVVMAYGALEERRIFEVELVAEDEVTGRGEAAPLEPYDGVSLERAAAALDAYRPILAGGDDLTGGELLDACAAADPLPQALAAIDLALWDRAGRRTGERVAALLTDDPADEVPVNATVTALDTDAAAAACATAADAGYRCVKLKVGVGDDAARVAAAREALGPEPELRLDANGAWTVREAIEIIDELARYGLELVEEPVHGIEELRAVREHVAVRIAMDETTSQPGAIASQAADAVCLKLTRCGGISGLLAAASLVRAHGAVAYIASTFDGPIGIAGGLHAAAALGTLPACGLGTLTLFEDASGAFSVVDGAVLLPDAPGLC